MKKIDKFFCVAFIAGTIYFAAYNILTRLIEIDFQIVEFLYKVALVTILVSVGWCLGKGISPYKVLERKSERRLIKGASPIMGKLQNIKGTTPKQGSGVR